MITRLRKNEIRALAREKLVEYEAMHLPVTPKSFAEGKVSIKVQSFDPPEPSISGFLMRVGSVFGIGYSKAIRSEGFQNFTVAHELGHYFIDDHPMAVLATGQHLSRAGFSSKDRYEHEADVFATEFLMPWKLIEPLVNARASGFDGIKFLAEACGSSLVASAIRWTEVTKESVAVVVSHLGVVEFMTASESFRQMGGIEWLRREDSLPAGVPSSRVCMDLDWLASCTPLEEASHLSAWFPSARHIEIEEDVVGLGSYQRLLTVLIADAELELGNDEDEETEDDYIERWKEGRFRSRRD